MRSTSSILKCAVFAAAALAGVHSSMAQDGPIVMKMGTATLNDTQHEWMKVFARLVGQASNGRIKPEIYPASQLGAIPRMIEGVQFGSIQAFVGPPEFLSGVDTRYEILSAPGLFKDVEHASRAVQDPEFNTAFLGLGANRNLKGIGVFLSGPMVFVTRMPIKRLTELEGKKVRVLAAALQTEQMRRLRGVAVPMALGEVMPALQQGALDGFMSSAPILPALRLYDAAKYMYETKHAVVVTMTVIGKNWFDKLPSDLQKVVIEAGRGATKETYQWAIDFVAQQRDAWLKAGGEIVAPTAADHAQLMKLMLPIGAEVTSRKPEEKALYDLLLRAAKRTE